MLEASFRALRTAPASSIFRVRVVSTKYAAVEDDSEDFGQSNVGVGTIGNSATFIVPDGPHTLKYTQKLFQCLRPAPPLRTSFICLVHRPGAIEARSRMAVLQQFARSFIQKKKKDKNHKASQPGSRNIWM